MDGVAEGESFLNGKVRLFGGDNREILKSIPDDSIDSICCDPPYALVSIVKRFGNPNAAPAKGNEAYMRASAGFMGKQWDTGESAHAVEFWQECLRVLKPGGYVVAFAGTRTYHRMACAIEDAGFEIRDQLQWLYGSGFPKSHDVSKGIDRRKNWNALPKLQTAIGSARKALGISQSEAARRMRLIGPDESLGGGGFMWFETGMRAPTREQWPRLKESLNIGNEFDLCFEEAEREITGTVDEWTDRSNYAITSKDGFRRDNPATASAIQWQGWGTALKPANEPICMARKPLSEKTVAANVLKWGTGAINVGACRVGAGGDEHADNVSGNTSYNAGSRTSGQTSRNPSTQHRDVSAQPHDDHASHLPNEALNEPTDLEFLNSQDGCRIDRRSNGEPSRQHVIHGQDALGPFGDADKSRRPDNAREYSHGCLSNSYPTPNIDAGRSKGRWPANVITDGSDEVVGMFPDSDHARGNKTPTKRQQSEGVWAKNGSRYGIGPDGETFSGDSGSAARFFYTAKADSDDRLGSRHPTVKPVDLMQWLVRLVTKVGGTVLDPFAGTGSTAEAAYREGMSCILIEREEEYQADIRRRMALVLSGPDERARESIKAKTKDLPPDHGPLFA